MKLEALTSNDLIILDQDYSSKREVFQAVADRLKQKGTISNTSNFIDSLYAREKDGPTGMDKGVAIPHAKSSQIKEPVFSIVRTKKPIDDWESIQPDNKVSLIFSLGNSQVGTQETST
jgi:mannitol/fructose-specific phosphotransferase system IIA component (Ntr-type)